tara:strand:+ start:82159 stop:82362 length:204 start_codon:yes stop_codon:yes gene_type:complete
MFTHEVQLIADTLYRGELVFSFCKIKQTLNSDNFKRWQESYLFRTDHIIQSALGFMGLRRKAKNSAA